MAGVLSLFVVILVWRFFILVGETVFSAAGLAPDAAAFEARSALAGAGYTTSQSEFVVDNPAAQRFASTLVLVGYFGPTIVLALLGVSFVLPTGEDLTARTITLVVLVGGLFVSDRLGVIRVIGERPARAVARRLLADDTFETWVVVGDRVVAAMLIPVDPTRSERIIATLNDPSISILAVEPAEPGDPIFPSETQLVDPRPGDRVVAFGPKQALESMRRRSS